MCITRKDYLENSAALHDDYFLQFSTTQIETLIGLITDQITKSDCLSLEAIPLTTWDELATQIRLCRAKLKSLGGVGSLSTRVCVLKAVAKSKNLGSSEEL